MVEEEGLRPLPAATLKIQPFEQDHMKRLQAICVSVRLRDVSSWGESLGRRAGLIWESVASRGQGGDSLRPGIGQQVAEVGVAGTCRRGGEDVLDV